MDIHTAVIQSSAENMTKSHTHEKSSDIYNYWKNSSTVCQVYQVSCCFQSSDGRTAIKWLQNYKTRTKFDNWTPHMNVNLWLWNIPHFVTAFWWCQKLCRRQSSTVHSVQVSWTPREQQDQMLLSVQGPVLPAELSDDNCRQYSIGNGWLPVIYSLMCIRQLIQD